MELVLLAYHSTKHVQPTSHAVPHCARMASALVKQRIRNVQDMPNVAPKNVAVMVFVFASPTTIDVPPMECVALGIARMEVADAVATIKHALDLWNVAQRNV